MISNEEIRKVKNEKNKICDDYYKTAKGLIYTKEMLDQIFNLLNLIN